MRHSTQGPRQPRDGLRAMGGVSLQPRHALPQGREALHAGQPPRPPSRSTDENGGRLPPREMGRGSGFHGAPSARTPGKVRQGFRGGLWRRVADHREGVPDGQVRARGAGNPPHRLQRTALHGFGRHRLQGGARCGPRAESLERYLRSRSPVRDRRQHRRVRAHHHRLHLARPRQGRQADCCRSALYSDCTQRGSVSAGAAREPISRC